jgi:hypothetical protein
VRLEKITEIGVRLVTHLFGRRLAAVLRLARIVFDAHAAHVQFSATLPAFIETA